jgi:predicted nucleic acid-binding Zn ribbon protein
MYLKERFLTLVLRLIERNVFMYCSTCGTPVAAELSFCKRCGTSLNKDRGASQENSMAGSLITGVVLVAVLGLGIMCGGAIALKKGAELNEPTVVFFMMLSFAIVGFVELFLVRQLSRLLGGHDQKRMAEPAQPLFQPAMVPASEVRAAHLRTLPEPIPSVTENTTRTLEHSFGQSLK